MIIRKLLVFVLATASVGCTTPSQIPSLQHEEALPDNQQQKQDELVARADQFHKELKRRGLISTDRQTHDYVGSIGASLIPKSVADEEINFFVLRNPTANAFATANGNIYINLGLLSILENRNQLAMVSAHEIAHVIQRHHLKDHLNNRNTIVTAHIANLMLFGTNVVYVPAGISLAGFSRENEFDADSVGLAYIHQAGYDTSQGIGTYDVFRSLPESAALKGSIFSSHPQNEDRIANLTRLADKQAPQQNLTGEEADEDFVTIRKKAISKVIQYRLRAHQHKLALDLLDRARPLIGNRPEYDYFVGETYRLLGDEPDRAADEEARLDGKRAASEQLMDSYRQKVSEHRHLARQAYVRAVEKNPDYPQSYKGLGLLARSEGKNAEALANFRTYLNLEQHPKDERFISRLVSALEGETHD